MATKEKAKPEEGVKRAKTPSYQSAYHGNDKASPLKKMMEKIDKKKVPSTVIDTIPFEQMFPDGLCKVVGNYYTRMVQFYDINYQLAQNDEKQHIFGEYCQFLNYFDETIHFQFCFINQRVDMEEYKKAITIPEQDDDFNLVRKEYAEYLRSQLEKGNNGIVKSKYLVFGIEARDKKQAVSRLEEDGNITMTSGCTNDPDGKIARENAQRKAQEKKVAEEKAAKKRAEKKKAEEELAEKRIENVDRFEIRFTGSSVESITQIMTQRMMSSDASASVTSGLDLKV